MPICRICGNERANEIYTAREMMYGSRELFDYFRCARCGCLQISEFPAEMARYYPDDYYSFATPDDAKKKDPLKRTLKAQRLDHWLGNWSSVGYLAAALFGPPSVTDHVLQEVRDIVPLNARSRILDVGCGSGGRLMQWSDYGFLNLDGYDPFIPHDIHYRNGVTIFKSLPAKGRKYEFVMLHHSFEHMPDPHGVLQSIRSRLAQQHIVMISVPLSSSLAWEKYGVNWVQLDPPRHFFLHTIESMEIVAKQAGFQVKNVVHNSTSFQFWGSEQYVRDIPLRNPRSHSNPESRLFTVEEMAQFDAEAVRLNRSGRGDQASFFLALR